MLHKLIFALPVSLFAGSLIFAHAASSGETDDDTAFGLKDIYSTILRVDQSPSQTQNIGLFSNTAGPAFDACQSFKQSRFDYAELLRTPDGIANRFMPFQGKQIAGIQIVRINVFDVEDPQENTPLFRLVNSLHMRTRQRVVRERLLFNEGDTLDPALVAETERNLRSMKFLADAFVMPTALCGDDVLLSVIVQDAWTTQPIISASSEGGDKSSRIGFAEGNFLGTGSEVSIVFTEEEDRNLIAYGFSKQFLFGRPLDIGFNFSDSSDGYIRRLAFGKPFYSERDKTAFGLFVNGRLLSYEVDQNEEVLAEYEREEDSLELQAAWQLRSRRGQGVWRFYAGLAAEEWRFRDFFSQVNLEQPLDESLSYPWAALEYRTSRFRVMSNINNINALEDIAIGPSAYVRFGYDGNTASNSAVSLIEAQFNQRWYTGDSLYGFAFSLAADVYERSELDRHSANFAGEYWNLLTDRQRLYSEVIYRYVKPNGIHDALSLGASAGLRGYPANFVLGDKAATARFEYRYHSGIHLLSVLRLGFAAYADVGYLRNDAFAIENQQHDKTILGNIGFGLRMTSSKTQVGNVVHIDIATPLAYRDAAGDFQVLLRAEGRF